MQLLVIGSRSQAVAGRGVDLGDHAVRVDRSQRQARVAGRVLGSVVDRREVVDDVELEVPALGLHVVLDHAFGRFVRGSQIVGSAA